MVIQNNYVGHRTIYQTQLFSDIRHDRNILMLKWKKLELRKRNVILIIRLDEIEKSSSQSCYVWLEEGNRNTGRDMSSAKGHGGDQEKEMNKEMIKALESIGILI